MKLCNNRVGLGPKSAWKGWHFYFTHGELPFPTTTGVHQAVTTMCVKQKLSDGVTSSEIIAHFC
jgi:hypothetical protein